MDPLAMTPVGGLDGGDGLLAGMSAESVTSVDENAQFSDWFVNYLSTASPADSSAAADFAMIVNSLTQWCVGHFTPEECAALAARLSDPALAFASASGSEAAVGVVAALAPGL